MTRNDIISKIRKRYGLTNKESKQLVKLFFKVFSKLLKEENRLEIRGLGVFKPKTYTKNNTFFLRINYKTSKTLLKKIN